MVKDPVCGVEIDPEVTRWQGKYLGETYYFCCLSCLEAFEKDPLRYIEQDHASRSAS